MSRVKALLRDGENVASAMYGAGYGSSSRLYEAADATFGMTPATYREGRRGGGDPLRLRRLPSWPRAWLRPTGRGVCFVAFDNRDDALLEELQAEFPAASLSRDDAGPQGMGGGGVSGAWKGARRTRRCRWTCAPRPSSGRCGGR